VGLESQIPHPVSAKRRGDKDGAPDLLLVAVAVEFAAIAIDVAVFAAEFAALVTSGGVVAVP
jgi:hypothetical protein